MQNLPYITLTITLQQRSNLTSFALLTGIIIHFIGKKVFLASLVLYPVEG